MDFDDRCNGLEIRRRLLSEVLHWLFTRACGAYKSVCDISYVTY